MFGLGKEKPGSADALYSDQKSRNGNYTQQYEYRTIIGVGEQEFDIELNAHAKLGWELVGFHVSSGGTSTLYYGALRRKMNP